MALKNEMPWRPIYEMYAAAAWLAIIPIYIIFAIGFSLPWVSMAIVVAFTLIMGLYRSHQTWQLLSLRLSLQGSAPDIIDPRQLANHSTKNLEKRWLGIGFNWMPEHTQRVYDLKGLNPNDFYAPKWFTKLYFKVKGEEPPKGDSLGAPWVQGIEPNATHIIVPYDIFYGHSLILGSTGSGKTRFAEILVTQDIHRGNVVIFIDPKGDLALKERMATECARAGRRFINFHLAFPNQSIRFDTLKNFNNPTEFASRISSLIPSETGSDAFTAFGWSVLNAITLGMMEIGEKPSLTKIRRYVEGGVGPLLEKALASYALRIDPHWQDIARGYVKNKTKDITGAATVEERLKGYLAYYNAELVANGKGYDVIDGLVTMHEHDASHFGKMVANLIPILSMLTSGELGKMLSPDYDDREDQRDIWDFKKVIDSNTCIYIGLDSMSNSTVASAVGSLLLSDAVSVAGSIYNFESEENRKISLFVDEAAEVVNPPFISILNKGRGAGFMAYVFTQTISDFVSKLGSESKARMMLGNFNNIFALRLRDGNTQEYISETFDKHYVTSKSISQGGGSDTEKTAAEFNGKISESRNSKLEQAIPLDVLGKLPNFHYIGSVAGGRIIKGKVPLIKSHV